MSGLPSISTARYDPWRGDSSLYDPRWSQVDDEVRAFVRSTATLDGSVGSGPLEGLGAGDDATLLLFARRSSVFGMRGRGPGAVRDGLAACALIDVDRTDPRDVLAVVALLHHALERLSVKPATVIAEAAERASPATADLLRSFIARPPSGRDLRDAWGYVETEAPGGVGLLGWGFRDYSPTADVSGAISEIAGMLTGDDYQADDPALAVEFPRVWLGGVGDGPVAAMLEAAPAAASVSARLQPHVSADHASQQLSAFLLEAASAAAATKLLSIGTSRGVEFTSAGAASGRLFCLLIARSFVRGVPHHETPASMDRFKGPLAAILARHSAMSAARPR